MVIRIAQPEQWSEKDLSWKAVRCPANDFAKQEAVGKNGQVMPMLLDSRHGEDDWNILVEGLNCRPG